MMVTFSKDSVTNADVIIGISKRVQEIWNSGKEDDRIEKAEVIQVRVPCNVTGPQDPCRGSVYTVMGTTNW